MILFMYILCKEMSHYSIRSDVPCSSFTNKQLQLDSYTWIVEIYKLPDQEVKSLHIFLYNIHVYPYVEFQERFYQ